MAHPSSNSSGTDRSVSKSLTFAPDFSSGHILTKVTINGKEFHAWDMPDKGWHIYPWQKYKIVVDDIERGRTFRVEYGVNDLASEGVADSTDVSNPQYQPNDPVGNLEGR